MKYFMTTKKLLRQQTCWAEFLLRFNFVVSYTSNRENKTTDLYTCWPNDYSANDYDA